MVTRPYFFISGRSRWVTEPCFYYQRPLLGDFEGKVKKNFGDKKAPTPKSESLLLSPSPQGGAGRVLLHKDFFAIHDVDAALHLLEALAGEVVDGRLTIFSSHLSIVNCADAC